MTRAQIADDIHSTDSWASISARLGVLQVLPSMNANGPARAAVEAAAAVVAAGGRAVVAAANGPLVFDLLRCGAVPVDLPLEGDGKLARRAYLRRLLELIQEHRISIVHAREPETGWFAREAASQSRSWFVTTCHGSFDNSTPALQERHAVMTRANRIVAVSDSVARHLSGHFPLPGGEPLVIPPGLALPRFDPARVSGERMAQLAQHWRLPDGVPAVMLPGRLTRSRGQRALIEALARLGPRELHCILVAEDPGSPGYRRELTELAEQFGMESRLSIVGDCRDMPAAYMLADVVVYARAGDNGFARVAAEAQAMGRPLVAYDSPALREQTEGGRMTWLVPPEDRGALAMAIAEALALSAAERQALAPQSSASVRQRYNRAHAAAAMIELYFGLLSEAKAA
jgi:glycosyltransferase involved in cell wall biosynthesis